MQGFQVQDSLLKFNLKHIKTLVAKRSSKKRAQEHPHREELVDYGLTPVDCETLNMEKLVWSELCKDGSEKGKRFKVYWTIWNEEKIGKQFKLPVLFTMEKGLCVFSSSMVKDLKKEEVKDAFHKEINQTAKK